jgi:hypothetical protein
MTVPLLILAVLAIFTTFAAAVAWTEFQTRGLLAPGAKRTN